MSVISLSIITLKHFNRIFIWLDSILCTYFKVFCFIFSYLLIDLLGYKYFSTGVYQASASHILSKHCANDPRSQPNFLFSNNL